MTVGFDTLSHGAKIRIGARDGIVCVTVCAYGECVTTELSSEHARAAAKALLHMAIDAEMHNTQPGSEP